MSTAEQALEGAILAVLAEDGAMTDLLGSPLRVMSVESPRPAYPWIEVVRHQSVPDGASEIEASEHRIDLAVESRMDGGVDGLAAVGAIRRALDASALVMDGWRCVLLVPVFTDALRANASTWRTVLRVKAVVEAV